MHATVPDVLDALKEAWQRYADDRDRLK